MQKQAKQTEEQMSGTRGVLVTSSSSRPPIVFAKLTAWRVCGDSVTPLYQVKSVPTTVVLAFKEHEAALNAIYGLSFFVTIFFSTLVPENEVRS